LEQLESYVQTIIEEGQAGDVDLKHLLRVCSVPPSVLGVVVQEPSPSFVDGKHPSYLLDSARTFIGWFDDSDAVVIVERKQTANIWITIRLDHNLMPVLGYVFY
jgi:hypothetical protein